MYEVQNELEGVVKLLLETKADPNLQDKVIVDKALTQRASTYLTTCGN